MSKLITAENIQELKEGSMVIKYPLTGEATNTLSLENKMDFQILRVGRIQHDIVDLFLSDSAGATIIPGITVSVGPLHKTMHEMVAEKKWWHY